MSTWSDVDTPHARCWTIRDRKDPREKDGNNQRIPLLAVTGYDALALIEGAAGHPRQRGSNASFPTTTNQRARLSRAPARDLSIKDLHFHDLRHEGTSRLFEAGFRIEQVALVTGHKDWKMLRRYTHLRPESLHALAASRAA